jgi:transcription elongation factor GreA
MIRGVNTYQIKCFFTSMSTDVQYLTHAKFTELEKELEFLKIERRKEVAEHLEYAKKLGDLSENAEYHQAREEQAEVEDRISRLENLLKNAQITEVGGGGDVITIGSTFRLLKDGDNKSYLYTIVGSEEADMAHGKISNLSPLGSSLLGHKKGDKVKVPTPKGTVVYTIDTIK